MAVVWTRDLEVDGEPERAETIPLVGVAEIDRQHRVFLQRWCALTDAQLRGDPRIVRANLWFLERYAAEHFDSEERTMTEARFPGLLAHRREHERFAERIRRVRIHVEAGRHIAESAHFGWIAQWFERHVRELDAELGRYLTRLAAPAQG
jgi:hemerythrin-like metal-binding protein